MIAPRELDRLSGGRADLAVVGGTVVSPPGEVTPRTVVIRDGRVLALLDPGQPVEATETVDATGMLVLPGLIDPHVHIGYTTGHGMPLDALSEHFETESASALVGGVTTMLINYRNPESYDVIWDQMVGAGETCSRVDFGFNLGITNEHQGRSIEAYARDLGVISFKFYMHYGMAEARATGNPPIAYDDGLLYQCMETISRVPGGMAMVHAENSEIIRRLRAELREAGREDLAAWSESRPALTEAEAVRRALFLGEQAGCPTYIVHLSSALALDAIRQHRARARTPTYVETCPHYLTHTKDSPVGLLGKVNPPLREDGDRWALWGALASGEIDTVGTDHCGLRRVDKGPDIWTATPGFPGMATMLPVLLQGVRDGRISLRDVVNATSFRPARLFGLHGKGALQPGADADLVIVDPELTQRVEPTMLASRSDFSLYEGWELTGWPVVTVIRGRVAMREGEILAEPGAGRYVPRGWGAGGRIARSEDAQEVAG